MASKDHDSSGELARRAADADRQLGIRLKAQAAELHEAHAEQMSRLQRKHDAELAERSTLLQARHEQVQQSQRAVKVAEEHAQAARDAQQRLQVTFSSMCLSSLEVCLIRVAIARRSVSCRLGLKGLAPSF